FMTRRSAISMSSRSAPTRRRPTWPWQVSSRSASCARNLNRRSVAVIVFSRRRAALILALVLAAALSAGRAIAQQAPAAAAAPEDPIRCWWRTSAGSVRVGETFSVVLTCAVLETEEVQVVPDQAALDGAVVPLAPFEVIKTEHPPDLRSGQRRFFQYDYTVQVI